MSNPEVEAAYEAGRREGIRIGQEMASYRERELHERFRLETEVLRRQLDMCIESMAKVQAIQPSRLVIHQPDGTISVGYENEFNHGIHSQF